MARRSDASPSLDAVYRRRHEQGYSDRYSPFNPAQLFMLQQRQRETLGLLRAKGFYPLDDRNILEIGCGGGGVLHEFLGYGAEPQRLHGIELLDWRVRGAKQRMPGTAFVCADGQQLPYPVHTFDLLLQFTVFTSIPNPAIKQRLAEEMVRVTKPGGAILWYDYWLNPINPDVRGIRLSEVRRLFPGAQITARQITLAPPITRRLVHHSWLLCAVLEKLRLLNTHYLALIQPGSP